MLQEETEEAKVVMKAAAPPPPETKRSSTFANRAVSEEALTPHHLCLATFPFPAV